MVLKAATFNRELITFMSQDYNKMPKTWTKLYITTKHHLKKKKNVFFFLTSLSERNEAVLQVQLYHMYHMFLT